MGYTFTHKQHMTRADLVELYDMVIDQDLQGFIFYDGGITSPTEWGEFMSSSQNWLIKVTAESGREAGMFWLSGFQGRTAQIHFCIWRDYMHKLEVARASLQFIRRQDFVDSLYGCTPGIFWPAVNLFEAMGAKILGDLPGACYISKTDKYVPGAISVLDLNLIQGD